MFVIWDALNARPVSWSKFKKSLFEKNLWLTESLIEMIWGRTWHTFWTIVKYYNNIFRSSKVAIYIFIMGRDILYKTICTPVVQTTIQIDKTQTKSWEVVTLFHSISYRRATIDKILMSSILCHQRYKQDSSYGGVDIPVSAFLSYWVTGVNFGYLSRHFFFVIQNTRLS